ncbi:MAG: asparagine synthase (glutamine-hydrolyzing) [Flavobacteriales bacterium]|nr:asparagine synthase (glutamine-hydrolyzing) [Flavobacteriales bacterium]
MCGIIGQVELRGTVNRVLFDRMRDTLAHRGPDGAGTWLSADGHFALGHRRLSFLDLSENGAQPMAHADGSLVVTLNGEIYNYVELRDELMSKGHVFHTATDTEVLLHGHTEWGIEGLLERITGMFAFALLNRNSNTLHLVRDRFGIKPLYYHLSAERLIFASELKGIMASGLVAKELDMAAFTDYFVYRYVPSPLTIWKGVSKLPPAHFMSISLEDLGHSTTEYWKLNAADGNCNPGQLADEVGAMLKESVRIHARSDVEVGTFLSGGYDSSAIALFLSEQNPSLRSFSIGFEGWEKSEHLAAALVADHLKIGNTTTVADRHSLDLLTGMAQVYDEPIADISIIPTLMVSRLAAQHVKAVMSGEGADEIFGGYDWQKRYMAELAQASEEASASMGSGLWGKFKTAFGIRPHSPIINHQSSIINFYAEAMSMGRFDREMLQEMLEPEHHHHIREDVDWFYRRHYRKELSPLKSIQNMDIKCFMGELVLTKIDRASMACSLEVRVPFLDHRLFERVFACKEQNYFRPEKAKFLLHENIKDRLPQAILHRKKQGFVGPDSYYMDIAWYTAQLANSRLAGDGIVRYAFISRLLEREDHWRLWKLAVMENWYRQWAAEA